MVIGGKWVADDDTVVRPYIWAHVGPGDGEPAHERFLVDTGADASRLSFGLMAQLGPAVRAEAIRHSLVGVGGRVEAALVNARIVFETADGRAVTINGPYLAATAASELDVSILGRDVLSNFDVILSRRRNEVLLVAGSHGYAVTG